MNTTHHTFGVAAYRLAHYVFPIIAGGVSYLTLRAGPWKIAHAAEASQPSHLTDRPSGLGAADPPAGLGGSTTGPTGPLDNKVCFSDTDLAQRSCCGT